MKNENIHVDELLKRALSSAEAPEPALLQKVKQLQFEEETILKKTAIKRSFGSVAAAAVALVIFTSTAFAAWYFLKPSDIADQFGDFALSAAFESDSAVNINETITSGDYIYTLLALVSGKDISDHPSTSNGEVRNDRTYAVLAIQKADGTPMPKTSDDEYGDQSFYVSPYIRGEKPWLLNAHTMNGGYSEMVLDSVAYRMVECDEVTMFADRGLYIGVNTGSFYDSQAFIYDEQTGELKANPDYDGSSAVFTLPIDPSLADPVKARQYLDTMWDEIGGEPGAGTGESSAGTNTGLDATLDDDYDTSEEANLKFVITD